jgi:hypothetical protein
MVLAACVEANASVVVVPCCYGTVSTEAAKNARNSQDVPRPCSKAFRSSMSEDEFGTIASGALYALVVCVSDYLLATSR